MFIKNKKDTDYTEVVKSTYILLSSEFGYTTRITDIWKLLAVSLNIPEFELLNHEYYLNGEFYSYLIDKQIEWSSGKNIDFSEIYEKILEFGDFTSSEKLVFSDSNIEERLWAIYLVISDPNNELIKINNKNND